MASANFKVRNGLEVTSDASIGGGLTASGLQYPTSDGSLNQVIITDGDGTLSFGQVTLNGLEDITVTGLQDGDILAYDAVTQNWVAQNSPDDLTLDGGTF